MFVSRANHSFVGPTSAMSYAMAKFVHKNCFSCLGVFSVENSVKPLVPFPDPCFIELSMFTL